MYNNVFPFFLLYKKNKSFSITKKRERKKKQKQKKIIKMIEKTRTKKRETIKFAGNANMLY